MAPCSNLGLCFGFPPLVCDAGLSVGSIRCEIEVGVRPRVRDIAQKTEMLVLKVSEAKALAQPLPIAPSLQQSSSGNQRARLQPVLAITWVERRTVVPTRWGQPSPQALHAPSEDFQQRIKRAMPSQSCVLFLCAKSCWLLRISGKTNKLFPRAQKPVAHMNPNATLMSFASALTTQCLRHGEKQSTSPSVCFMWCRNHISRSNQHRLAIPSSLGSGVGDPVSM